MTDDHHNTRVDVALALGGFVVFCSCGNLTGFADSAAGADKIAADHKTKAAPDDGDDACPGHYDDDATLTSGVVIGEPTFCDGSCVQ